MSEEVKEEKSINKAIQFKTYLNDGLNSKISGGKNITLLGKVQQDNSYIQFDFELIIQGTRDELFDY